MSTREAILARVREALRPPTDPHVRANPGMDTKPGMYMPGSGAEEHPDFRAWLPRVGDSFEQRAALFAEHSAALKTAFYRVDDRAAMLDLLERIATQEGWSRLGSHHAPLNDAACEKLGLPVTWTDPGYDARELERCDAAVTGCDALIAQTGSVLVTAPSAGGRALSVLPPHHVVLATRDQLAPDLADGYRRLRERFGDHYPSFMSLITGPSRTGDIERILVLGAHGPRKLTVILLNTGARSQETGVSQAP